MIKSMGKVQVDITQLQKNIRCIKERTSSRILFAVKGDGYGHGMIEVSEAAQEVGVDYLGVSSLHEMQRLKEANLKLPIFVLGPSRLTDIRELVDPSVRITVTKKELAEALNQVGQEKGMTIPVHIKVDTGLGRIGFSPEEVPQVLPLIRRLPFLTIEGIFTHLSVAYSIKKEDQEYTQGQLETFQDLLEELDREGLLPPLRHVANSAAFIQYQKEVTRGYFNLIRIGTLIYGRAEVKREWTHQIVPCISLSTEIIELRKVPKGRDISYGRTYQTPSQRTLAILPLGYGDGVNRRLSNRGYVLIHGERAPIVGRICMNQTIVDVTELKRCELGDEAFFMGKGIPLEELMEQTQGSFTELTLPLAQRNFERSYLK